MQVQQKDISSVATEFLVTFSAKEITEKIEKWLVRKSAHVHKDGFRPGKVPLSVVRTHYFAEAESDTLHDVIQSFVTDTAEEKNFNLATNPEYEITSYKRGEDFSFRVTFSFEPELDLKKFETLPFEKLICPLTLDATKEKIESICNTFPKDVLKDKKIEKGDFIKASLTLIDEGKEPSVLVESARIDIDPSDNSFLKDFIDDFVSQQAGATLEKDVLLPQDFPIKKLRGKKKTLRITVLGVYHTGPHGLDEEVLEKWGGISAEDFKEFLFRLQTCQRENDLLTCNKRALLDLLAAAYDMEVPEVLVQRDFQQVLQYLIPELKRAREIDDEEVRGKTDEQVLEEYRALSHRRVRLAFLIEKIAKEYDIKLTTKQKEDRINEYLGQFPEKARRKIFEENKGDAVFWQSVFAPVLEDLVIQKILTFPNVKEKEVSEEEFQAILKDVLPEPREDEANA
ncbi:trigger factor [Alphaproteobacteria bacterium]|nr:trigger factor [Alphaproteobacteria bacterium]